MPNPTSPDFWRLERILFQQELIDPLMEIILHGVELGLDSLPPQLSILADWDVINRDALRYLNSDQLSTIRDILETTRRQATGIIQDWVLSGEPKTALDTRLTPLFGNRRAAVIAATEVTRMYAEGNLTAWRSTGVVMGKRWMTAKDELVCFPAWTMVKTSKGDVPIQHIKPGDRVLTRKGYKRVIATRAKEYAGAMTTIKAGGRKLTATADHPIWESNKGWLRAGQFKPGNLVNLYDNKVANVEGVINFSVGNSDNVPTPIIKELRFTGVPCFVPVPVCAINFQGNAVIRNEKINGVTPHFSLLNVGDGNYIQSDSNRLFKACLARESAVAGERAKHSAITGRVSKFFAAILAGDILRRAATFLRAIMPVKAFFGYKDFATAFTGRVFGFGKPALYTANGKPVGNLVVDAERFSALGANLFHHLGGAGGFIALSGAESPFPLKLRPAKVPPAMIANRLSDRFSLGNPVTLGRAMDALVLSPLRPLKWLSAGVASVNKWHSQLLIDIDVLYHKLSGTSITVYDIQVEDEPEFYANGILVHNCPLCAPLNGQIVELESTFAQSPSILAQSSQVKALFGKDATPEMLYNRASSLLKGSGASVKAPPRHVGCRCWLQPVVSAAALGEKIKGILGRYEAELFMAQIATGGKVWLIP